MRSAQQTAPVNARATSLRSRWNRAFAALFAVVVVGGMASIAGTRALVGTFRHAAEQVEADASLLADLRADILPHALNLVAVAEVDVDRGAALEASITDAFETGITTSQAPDEQALLREALVRWQAMVAVATGPGQEPLDYATRGRAVAEGVPEVLGLLDQAGEKGRAHARADLARARGVERAAMAAQAALILLMTGLMIRFARRLSAEVLRPVGLLRDSANHLAAGNLDHHVELNRTDELGDLAGSFNAMADAIAGSQRSLTRQASHDSLTGLANRAAFHARLEVALSHRERRSGTQAVLFVDLDDFKDVNDTLGHAAGDELLCVAAARLGDVLRPGDLVARLGGDEFALLLDSVPDASVALQVAERAVAALAKPVEIAGTSVHVGASVGLALRHDGSDPESLMREADVAMYTAKGRGKNRVERYNATLNPTSSSGSRR